MVLVANGRDAITRSSLGSHEVGSGLTNIRFLG